MTDIFKVTWNGDAGEESEMHATGVKAKAAAKGLREAGINSLIEKITLRPMGKKDLICAIYNGNLHTGYSLGEAGEVGFAEKVETLKEVAGVKKPKDPVAAAAMRAKAVANKHRGIKPPNAAVEAIGQKDEPVKTKIDKSSETGAAAKKVGVNKPTTPVNKGVSDQAPKAENKGDMTTADLKKSGGIKL